MLLNYITWNADPEIFSIFGRLAIRWYGLFFALSFYLGYVIMAQFFKREKVPMDFLEKLLIYVAVGTIIGARLGHCLFYEPSYYLRNPFEIIKIWQGGLASHGAAIGIVIALYFFYRKTKKTMLWTLDRVVIVVALAGFFIRMGNLMNSEIYGIPTYDKNGFVYARSFSSYYDDDEYVKNIKFTSLTDEKAVKGRFAPIQAEIEFNRKLRDEAKISNFMQKDVRFRLSKDTSDLEINVALLPGQEFTYDLNREGPVYKATFNLWGVPKYPTQIYEAGAYLFIFLLLLALYYKNNGKLYSGFLFGLFLTLVFSARFVIEIVKENQVPFEENLSLNMGQLLSIPFVIIGLFFIAYSFKTKKAL